MGRRCCKNPLRIPPQAAELAALGVGASAPVALGFTVGGLVPSALALVALGVTMNGGKLLGAKPAARLAQGALAATVFGFVWNARNSAASHDGNVRTADLFAMR